jgi:hypothetical protein
LSLKNKITKILLEKMGDAVYEAYFRIDYKRKYRFADILTTIRSLRGVTIVEPQGTRTKMGSDLDRSRLEIKFVPVSGSIKEYVAAFMDDVRKVDGVSSFIFEKIINIEKIKKIDR